MAILASTDALRDALAIVKPVQIAVAFIGRDWKQILGIEDDGRDAHPLRELIVSPGIGSNPAAILEAAKLLGWDHVHLLDNLHSKIYIGSNTAIVASANLSRNAFGVLQGDGANILALLEETGVRVQVPGDVETLRSLFKHYRELAQKSYPDKKSKLLRVRQLRAARDRAAESGIGNADEPPQFGNYLPSEADDFDVCWYRPSDDCALDQQAVMQKVFGVTVEGTTDRIASWMGFTDDDDIKPHRWVLAWEATNQSKCATRLPFWIYVHDAVPNVVSGDPDYPNAAIQFAEKVRFVPPQPFKIDRAFRDTFATVIQRPKFGLLRPPTEPEKLWRIRDARGLIAEFIGALKAQHG